MDRSVFDLVTQFGGASIGIGKEIFLDSETEQADEEADQGNGDRDAVHADSARLSGDELAGLGKKGKVDERGHECCQG